MTCEMFIDTNIVRSTYNKLRVCRHNKRFQMAIFALVTYTCQIGAVFCYYHLILNIRFK